MNLEIVYNQIIDQFDNDEKEALLQQYPQFKLLSWDSCRQLAANNTELESHGFNHEISHNNQSIETTNIEIIKSKQLIKNKLVRNTISYAYPNGDSETVIDILRRNEYKLTFITKEGLFNSNSSPMLIQKLKLPNNISSYIINIHT